MDTLVIMACLTRFPIKWTFIIISCVSVHEMSLELILKYQLDFLINNKGLVISKKETPKYKKIVQETQPHRQFMIVCDIVIVHET